MFNRWKPFPKYKPKEKGWYQCSIRYGEEPDEAYVMDLWWNDKLEVWKDNRRLHVFEIHEVYGWGTDIRDKPIKERIRYDHLCERDDVIAFRKLPKIYK